MSAVEPTLFLNQTNSFEAGSIQSEMTTCISNNHPLFQNENNLFYGILEEAVCRTIYEDNIKSFQRTHVGRGDY